MTLCVCLQSTKVEHNRKTSKRLLGERQKGPISKIFINLDTYFNIFCKIFQLKIDFQRQGLLWAELSQAGLQGRVLPPTFPPKTTQTTNIHTQAPAAWLNTSSFSPPPGGK